MEKSKLLVLLSTFSTAEWRKFGEFLESPYFNKNENVKKLYCFIKNNHSKLALNKKDAFKAAFPSEIYEDNRLGYVMNSLLNLAEQFLSVEHLFKHENQLRRKVLTEYSKRKLEKHFDFLLHKSLKELEKTPLDTEWLLDRFQFSEIKLAHFTDKKVRRFDPSIKEAHEALNDYYYVKLLKSSCSLLNWEVVVSGDFSLSELSKKIIHELKNVIQPNSPLLEIYLKIFQSFSEESQDSSVHFKELRKLMKNYEHIIAKDEMQEIYLYAINFCARKIRKGEHEYTSLMLDIYYKGIKSGVLFENNHLSHWTYTNVVKLGLMQKKFEWTEKFIHQHKTDLAPKFYSDAFYFNLADLYFHKGFFGEVLTELNKLQFSDTYYKLGSRMIQIKTYYETGEMETLLSLLASFTIFLKRDKNISSGHKNTCLNFCRLLHQILKDKQKKRDKLLEDIKTTQPLAERAWLLKVWEEHGKPAKQQASR